MSCSKTCGGGTMVQKRLCNDPAPSHGGRTCVGLMEEVTTCNTQPCTTVDGGWSQWKDSGCSQTCGGGFIAKVRKCNNPAPVHGGRNCTGQSFSLEDCNKNPCPGN
ncbi:hypothetical protein FSP39_000505 [Pinctada imbricata]|uniref:Uncharacterized protein n=1 Tax=Pinctada imbricata TaxID=66713 RepID=A0AA88YMN7_PINIB|nr:hypothetical protein FSP39_000505 [Pinctada imbricata]